MTIPTSLAPGVYWQLACADDRRAVPESDELNNCRTSATPIEIGRPDLVESAVTEPPAILAPGMRFTIFDTAHNASAVTAAATRTRYYLSADGVRADADVLLIGSRNVPALDAGESSTGSRTVTVPDGTPLGSYRLLACADDLEKVVESDESNNCLASAGVALVALPDLVASDVTGLPQSAVVGGARFTLTDTTRNQGEGAAAATTTRYYLSQDAAWAPVTCS